MAGNGQDMPVSGGHVGGNKFQFSGGTTGQVNLGLPEDVEDDYEARAAAGSPTPPHVRGRRTLHSAAYMAEDPSTDNMLSNAGYQAPAPPSYFNENCEEFPAFNDTSNMNMNVNNYGQASTATAQGPNANLQGTHSQGSFHSSKSSVEILGPATATSAFNTGTFPMRARGDSSSSKIVVDPIGSPAVTNTTTGQSTQRSSTTYMRPRVDSTSSNAYATHSHGLPKGVQELPGSTLFPPPSKPAPSAAVQGQGNLKGVNAYNQVPDRVSAAASQTQAAPVSINNTRSDRQQSSISSTQGQAFFGQHSRQPSIDSSRHGSAKTTQPKKSTNSQGFDGAGYDDAATARARASDAAFMAAFNVDPSSGAVDSAQLVRNAFVGLHNQLADHSRAMSTMQAADRILNGRVIHLEQRMSRLEIMGGMQNQATLAPQTVGLAPYRGNPQTAHQVMFAGMPEAYPGAAQFATQQHSGRGIDFEGIPIRQTMYQHPPVPQPQVYHQPHQINVNIATIRDDVYSTPIDLNTLYRVSLHDLVNNTTRKMDEFVHRWISRDQMQLHSQDPAMRSLIFLGREHLDHRQMATNMLDEFEPRVALVTGILNRALVQNIYSIALISEIYGNLNTDYHRIWLEELRVKNVFVEANDYNKRNGLAFERAKLARNMTSFPDFWRLAQAFAWHQTREILHSTSPAFPQLGNNYVLSALAPIVFDAVKITVRMRMETKYFETNFLRYGERWDHRTMTQCSPELLGHPCDQEPPIHVVRCTVAPQHTEKSFYNGRIKITTLQKHKVTLCDRKIHLRGR